VRPRTDWRGQYEGGLFSGGWPECTGTNGPNCVFTDWPSLDMHTYLDGQPRPLADWMGSLIQDQRDQSGLLFRRNRYYDPATGQFTQQDPIGIAGGMNLYGIGRWSEGGASAAPSVASGARSPTIRASWSIRTTR
jgi:hypothetical protein